MTRRRTCRGCVATTLAGSAQLSLLYRNTYKNTISTIVPIKEHHLHGSHVDCIRLVSFTLNATSKGYSSHGKKYYIKGARVVCY